MTQRQKAINFFNGGKIREALKIAKELDITFTKEEISTLQIAYECYTGKEVFYRMIKINTELKKKEAIILLENLKKSH